jgi:hypothetical protein
MSTLWRIKLVTVFLHDLHVDNASLLSLGGQSTRISKGRVIPTHSWSMQALLPHEHHYPPQYQCLLEPEAV